MDAVPSTRTGPATVWHRAPGRARRPTEQQAQIAPSDVGERGRRLGEEREAEMGRVEGNGRLHVVDHVADVDGGHALIAWSTRSPDPPAGGATAGSSARGPWRS